MNILLLQNCQEEQVRADFISEGTQKQGSGELVDTQRIAEVLKEIEEAEIMEIQFSHNDKEERFIVNQKVFSRILNDPVATYLKTSNNVSLALFQHYEYGFSFHTECQPCILKFLLNAISWHMVQLYSKMLGWIGNFISPDQLVELISLGTDTYK